MGRHKKVEEIDVEVDAKDMKDKKVVDVEENQSKDLIYTFQILSWVFLLGGIGAVIVWIVYVALYAGSSDEFGDRNSNELINAEICFQGAVASFLAYIVFRHHYRHY